MIPLRPSGIKEIESIVQLKTDCISLSQGANKMGGIPSQIKKYLQEEILITDKADYYENIQLTMYLKDKIASTINRNHGSRVKPEQIMITHGSIGAVAVAVLGLFDAGDEIILPEATYPVYQNILHTGKVKPVFVSNEVSSNDCTTWGLNIDAIKAATTSKTRGILFSHPTNPTGYIASKDELITLLAWCEENGIYLIVDEVYEDFIFDGEFFSTACFAQDSNRIIRTSSFSKNYAMSGWRIGHMVVPEELVSHLDIVQHALLICPSVLGQWAAIYALDHPELITPFYDIAKNNRDLICEKLAPLTRADLISFQKPRGSFFLFLKTHEKDSRALCKELIEKARVSLIPGDTFGPSCSSYLRLCYARTPEVVLEGITRLVHYLETHGE